MNLLNEAEKIVEAKEKGNPCSMCKWAKRSFMDMIFLNGFRFARCVHPTMGGNVLRDSLSGKTEFIFCSVMRQPFLDMMDSFRSIVTDEKPRFCGQEGKFFESK